MAIIATVALFGCERGEAFLSRAAADARVRFPDARIVRRSAGAHAGDVEPFVAVYTEARFARVIDDHRAKGITVLTEHDLATRGPEEADQPPTVADDREGHQGKEDVAALDPPRRGRPRRGA